MPYKLKSRPVHLVLDNEATIREDDCSMQTHINDFEFLVKYASVFSSVRTG